MQKQKTTYAEQIKASQVILGGFKQQQDSFIEKGYTTEKYITDFETLLNGTIEFNNEQEKSKAAMVSNTDELNQKLDELRKMRQQLKQIVKSHVPIPQWKSFGMQYRRMGPKSAATPDNPPDDINDDNPIDNAVPQKEAVKKVTVDGKIDIREMTETTG